MLFDRPEQPTEVQKELRSVQGTWRVHLQSQDQKVDLHIYGTCGVYEVANEFAKIIHQCPTREEKFVGKLQNIKLNSRKKITCEMLYNSWSENRRVFELQKGTLSFYVDDEDRMIGKWVMGGAKGTLEGKRKVSSEDFFEDEIVDDDSVSSEEGAIKQEQSAHSLYTPPKRTKIKESKYHGIEHDPVTNKWKSTIVINENLLDVQFEASKPTSEDALADIMRSQIQSALALNESVSNPLGGCLKQKCDGVVVDSLSSRLSRYRGIYFDDVNKIWRSDVLIDNQLLSVEVEDSEPHAEDALAQKVREKVAHALTINVSISDRRAGQLKLPETSFMPHMKRRLEIKEEIPQRRKRVKPNRSTPAKAQMLSGYPGSEQCEEPIPNDPVGKVKTEEAFKGDGRFQFSINPDAYAVFQKSNFLPESAVVQIKSFLSSRQVIKPGEVKVPKWRGNGATFRYTKSEDQWIEICDKKKEVNGVWTRACKVEIPSSNFSTSGRLVTIADLQGKWYNNYGSIIRVEGHIVKMYSHSVFMGFFQIEERPEAFVFHYGSSFWWVPKNMQQEQTTIKWLGSSENVTWRRTKSMRKISKNKKKASVSGAMSSLDKDGDLPMVKPPCESDSYSVSDSADSDYSKPDKKARFAKCECCHLPAKLNDGGICDHCISLALEDSTKNPINTSKSRKRKGSNQDSEKAKRRKSNVVDARKTESKKPDANTKRKKKAKEHIDMTLKQKELESKTRAEKIEWLCAKYAMLTEEQRAGMSLPFAKILSREHSGALILDLDKLSDENISKCCVWVIIELEQARVGRYNTRRASAAGKNSADTVSKSDIIRHVGIYWNEAEGKFEARYELDGCRRIVFAGKLYDEVLRKLVEDTNETRAQGSTVSHRIADFIDQTLPRVPQPHIGIEKVEDWYVIRYPVNGKMRLVGYSRDYSVALRMLQRDMEKQLVSGNRFWHLVGTLRADPRDVVGIIYDPDRVVWLGRYMINGFDCIEVEPCQDRERLLENLKESVRSNELKGHDCGRAGKPRIGHYGIRYEKESGQYIAEVFISKIRTEVRRSIHYIEVLNSLLSFVQKEQAEGRMIGSICGSPRQKEDENFHWQLDDLTEDGEHVGMHREPDGRWKGVLIFKGEQICVSESYDYDFVLKNLQFFSSRLLRSFPNEFSSRAGRLLEEHHGIRFSGGDDCAFVASYWLNDGERIVHRHKDYLLCLQALKADVENMTKQGHQIDKVIGKSRIETELRLQKRQEPKRSAHFGVAWNPNTQQYDGIYNANSKPRHVVSALDYKEVVRAVQVDVARQKSLGVTVSPVIGTLKDPGFTLSPPEPSKHHGIEYDDFKKQYVASYLLDGKLRFVKMSRHYDDLVKALQTDVLINRRLCRHVSKLNIGEPKNLPPIHFEKLKEIFVQSAPSPNVRVTKQRASKSIAHKRPKPKISPPKVEVDIKVPQTIPRRKETVNNPKMKQLLQQPKMQQLFNRARPSKGIGKLSAKPPLPVRAKMVDIPVPRSPIQIVKTNAVYTSSSVPTLSNQLQTVSTGGSYALTGAASKTSVIFEALWKSLPGAMRNPLMKEKLLHEGFDDPDMWEIILQENSEGKTDCLNDVFARTKDQKILLVKMKKAKELLRERGLWPSA